MVIRMKVKLNRSDFLKSWNLTERSAASGSTMNIFSTIRLTASEEKTELQATDIKTSIICRAAGVTVLEPGEALIPLKGVSELFKKAGSSELELEITDNKATMKSGKSRYSFSTYPVSDFPKLPSSSMAELFCATDAESLIRVIDRGSICASTGDEYPQFLASALFELKGGMLRVVSTDKRRLALAECEVSRMHDAADASAENTSLLLPMKGLKELVRILGMLDGSQTIEVLFDDSQVYFSSDGMEFALRRVESKFPPYERILPDTHGTTATFDRAELASALERIDVVVRDYNRIVKINISPDGESSMSGSAPEFGEAVESVLCEVTGEPVYIGFNTRFFYEALKILSDQKVSLGFNGNDGHMSIKEAGSDRFLCLIAPVEIGEDEDEDVPADDESVPADEEDGGDVR